MAVLPAHIVREFRKAYRATQITYTNQFNKIYNNAADLAKKKMKEAQKLSATDKVLASKQMQYIRTFYRPTEMREGTKKGDEGWLLTKYKPKVMKLIKKLEEAKKGNDKEKIDAAIKELKITIKKFRGKIDLFNANPEAWNRDREL